MEQRIQKIIAAAGVGSRRHGESLIQEGRVTVNGTIATLGQRADPEKDRILLDGKPLVAEKTHYYLMLNKPRGYVTTMSDERGRRTAAQLVRSFGKRVYPVGRLDLDSEGLLLFTNDGALTHALLHPSHRIEKEYHVRVQGDVDAAIPVLQGRMELDGVVLAPARVGILSWEGDRALISVVIHQGLNRQVRRMCAKAGLKVLRLKRVREGTLQLGKLAAGAWRELTEEEVRSLKKGV